MALTTGPSTSAKVRKREAIRTWVLHRDLATRLARQPLAATVAAGRDLRRCPSDPLRSQPAVSTLEGHPWVVQRTAVRTDRPAVRVRQAAAMVQKAAATVDILVRHLI